MNVEDDFERRLRRAANDHATRSEAQDRANEREKQEREKFLVDFRAKIRSTIEPTMQRAGRIIEEAGRVKFHVDITNGRESSSDSASIVLRTAKKLSMLVFLADPLAMRIDIVQSDNEPPHTFGIEKETKRTRIADCEVETIDSPFVEKKIAEFAELFLA